MIEEVSRLVKKINNQKYLSEDIMLWGSPVVSFGNIKTSKIATLGINPSNREFVDEKGDELSGTYRRFHTLASLGLDSWSEVEEEHLLKILDSCENYFSGNPYDAWFKKLDYIISGSSMSYYFPSGEACHLDLVPFATSNKWSEISSVKKSSLLESNADFLGEILLNSSIHTIVLNGKTVVDNFEKITNSVFEKEEMEDWKLKRKSSDGVLGYAYSGRVDKIGKISLKKSILVLGYNHNIQSSYGVSNNVVASIRNWVSSKINDELYEK